MIGFALLGLTVRSDALLIAAPITSLHYTPNHNFGPGGTYLPGRARFNIADVSNVGELRYLPTGVKALVWVGQCDGVTPKFLKTVRPFLGNPNVFGFYLMDNPDPRRRMLSLSSSPPCTGAHLRAESDWIHTNAPEAKTFIILMNLSSAKHPGFPSVYRPADVHVDLFGLDPYPCRSELKVCDYAMIDRYVAAAEAIGVRRSRIVPIYQTFGGGAWTDDGGGSYRLPTFQQEQRIMARWQTLLGTAVFDYAYSWGSQNRDRSLEHAADLRVLFALHNGPRGGAAADAAAIRKDVQ